MVRERLEKLEFLTVMNAFQKINKNILNFAKKKEKIQNACFALSSYNVPAFLHEKEKICMYRATQFWVR
jgi:hypothetical protein